MYRLWPFSYIKTISCNILSVLKSCTDFSKHVKHECLVKNLTELLNIISFLFIILHLKKMKRNVFMMQEKIYTSGNFYARKSDCN